MSVVNDLSKGRTVSNQTRKNEGPVPGKNEGQVLERLALIDADLLDADLVDAVTARARAQDRAEAVQDRRQAAQHALDKATFALGAPSLDELYRLAEEAAGWDRVSQKMLVPDLPPEIVARVGQAASLKVRTGGQDLTVRRPAYLVERDVFDNLPPVFVALHKLKPPAITAGELAAIDGFEAAAEAVRQWEAGAATLPQALTGPGADILSGLGAVSGYRASRVDVAARVAKANAVTEAADAERAQLGLTWRAPQQ